MASYDAIARRRRHAPTLTRAEQFLRDHPEPVGVPAVAAQVTPEQPTRVEARTQASQASDDVPREWYDEAVKQLREARAAAAEPVTGAGYSRRYRALVMAVEARLDERTDLTPYDVLVARVMLDTANAVSRETWQSVETIARHAHVCEDTVTSCIAALRRAGILELAKRGGRGRGKTNRYRFLNSNSQTGARYSADEAA